MTGTTAGSERTSGVTGFWRQHRAADRPDRLPFCCGSAPQTLRCPAGRGWSGRRLPWPCNAVCAAVAGLQSGTRDVAVGQCCSCVPMRADRSGSGSSEWVHGCSLPVSAVGAWVLLACQCSTVTGQHPCLEHAVSCESQGCLILPAAAQLQSPVRPASAQPRAHLLEFMHLAQLLAPFILRKQLALHVHLHQQGAHSVGCAGSLLLTPGVAEQAQREQHPPAAG